MGSPVQNPGYFGNQPSNYSENNQLNELEQSENRAYQPQPDPTPAPDPTPDASSAISGVPGADSNLFEAVSGAYQSQVEQGNVGIPDDSGSNASGDSAAAAADSSSGGGDQGGGASDAGGSSDGGGGSDAGGGPD